MAAPTAPTFGVTPALLEDKYLEGRGITGLPRLVTAATEVIDEIAGDVEGRLHASKVDADQVNEAHSPKTYRWLQTTICYGAAAEFIRRTAKEEVAVAESWEAKYQARLRQLSTSPETCLTDLHLLKPASGTIYNFR